MASITVMGRSFQVKIKFTIAHYPCVWDLHYPCVWDLHSLVLVIVVLRLRDDGGLLD
jgi:hypothetical protein